jgi:hypothetical protein
MPLIPFASFLVGSLLSLLIPVGVLIALTVWYTRALRRVPSSPEPIPPTHAEREVSRAADGDAIPRADAIPGATGDQFPAGRSRATADGP